MRYVYTIFGMTYKLELSTRPAKALGDIELWNLAEAQLGELMLLMLLDMIINVNVIMNVIIIIMITIIISTIVIAITTIIIVIINTTIIIIIISAEALDEFAGVGQWRINPGDGAFYGPKIDIKVFDAMDRIHQCATVQLDFQLPIRFQLEYKAAGSSNNNNNNNSGGVGVDNDVSFQRPVMVHRAMLGSVERMAAVLTEHWGGKWPFWLSPRQCIVVPIDLKFVDYAYDVQQLIHESGYYVDVDDSTNTLNKKVREAQVSQYNFILVVGEKEMLSKSVNIRTRDNEIQGTITIDEVKEKFRLLVEKFE